MIKNADVVKHVPLELNYCSDNASKKKKITSFTSLGCVFSVTLKQIIKLYSLSKSDECYSGTPTNCLPFITLAN